MKTKTSCWINKSNSKVKLTIDLGNGTKEFLFDPAEAIALDPIFDKAVNSLCPQLVKVDEKELMYYFVCDTGESAYIEDEE